MDLSQIEAIYFLPPQKAGSNKGLWLQLIKSVEARAGEFNMKRKPQPKAAWLFLIDFCPLPGNIQQAASQILSSGKDLGLGWLNCSQCYLLCTFLELGQGSKASGHPSTRTLDRWSSPTLVFGGQRFG